MNQFILDSFRKLWQRALLRGVQFSSSYMKLSFLYLMRDPWNLEGSGETLRFKETNKRIGQIFDPSVSILELGSGEGHQSKFLQQISSHVVGVELSRLAVLRARRRVPGVKYYCGRIEELSGLLDEKGFDLITACEVLYYAEDPSRCIEEMKKVAPAIFVSIVNTRSERLQNILSDEGWIRLEDIVVNESVWECFLWRKI